MEIKVTKNNVTIQDIDPVHSGEFNVNQCNFTFSETYTNDLVKKAIFTKLKYNASYEVTVENDTCIIPYEVLEEQGEVQIGVYAYEVDGEDLVLRYSPKATRFMVGKGSYIGANDGTIKVPALTIEEYEQALNNLLADVEASKEQIVEEVTEEAQVIVNQYAQEVIDQIPTGTVTGAFINIQDSSNLPFKDFALQGNATQDGTPTPDNEVPIQVVTGDVGVNVVGKNFLNYNLARLKQLNTNGTWNNNVYTYNGITYTVNDDMTISTSGTASSTSYLYLANSSNINLAKGNNYILSGSPQGSTVLGYCIRLYTGSSYESALSSGLTFIYNSQSSIRINIYSNINANGLVFKPMIEYGTTATSYVPYQGIQTTTIPLGDIELAKKATYTDILFKNTKNSENYNSTLTENSWYKKSNVRKFVFTGASSENWTIDSNGRFRIALGMTINQITGGAWCNRFTEKTLEQLKTEYGKYSVYTNTLYIGYQYETTVDGFKTWLASNNVIIYGYVPTYYTEITDTDLINALEQVLAMHTNKNVTNIFFTVETTATEPTGEFTYRKDLETLFNNLAGVNSLNANSINTSSIQMNTGSLVGLGNTANLNMIDEVNTDETSNLDVIDDNNSGDTI